VTAGYLLRSAYEQIAGHLKWGGFAFAAIIVIVMIVVHFAKQRLEATAAKMANSPAKREI
jgi:hypothetical protein